MPRPTQSAPAKTTATTVGDHALLEQLLRENLELTKQIHQQSQKTRKYILFGQVFNVVKVVVIIGPLIFALIYLPPLLSSMLGTYTDLLGGGTSQTLLEGNSFLNDIFPTDQ